MTIVVTANQPGFQPATGDPEIWSKRNAWAPERNR
jgi:hypothetical protein